MVLVKNYFSVISAGTEKTTIDSRKSSLVERARTQPDEVRKVLDEVRRTGLFTTYKRIMSKLDSSTGLGYSSSGIVLAIDADVQDLEVGTRVACAGADYAYHSDIIVAPRNLVVPIPESVPMESAAYTTIGAIALQGVRQANPTLGETVAVIGLGLLGQFTIQFLKANGCRVVGVDLNPFVLDLARTSGCDLVLHRRNDPVEQSILSFTHGHGVDSVIITAGTKDNDPIELAGRIARERATIVLVGASKADIPRAEFFRKELELRYSRSYGPGRYNPEYEERNLDFPIGYVRWTENRNMQAFLQLIAEKKIDTNILTTHRFTLDEALKAYDLIEGEQSAPYVGIVLSYEDLRHDEIQRIASSDTVVQPITISPKRSSLTVGFIGAGSFAAGYLLPHLHAMEDVTLSTVCNRTGLTSADMRNKFSFHKSTTNANEIFQDEFIGTVFIATRHGDHARLASDALQHGQHVFVEKPLALNEDELMNIESLMRSGPNGEEPLLLMVGYNRRFAPLVIEMKSFFQPALEPFVIHYSINAGFLPKEHWTQDPIDGGGRIIGEVCHFIDTIQFITDAFPVRVFAECIATQNERITPYDNLHVTLRMSDGSSACISYVSNGDPSLPKERIVVTNNQATAVLNNFTELRLTRNGKSTVKRSPGDKGHADEVQAFMNAIRQRKSEVIPLESLYVTSRTTFRILDSLNQKSVAIV